MLVESFARPFNFHLDFVSPSTVERCSFLPWLVHQVASGINWGDQSPDTVSLPATNVYKPEFVNRSNPLVGSAYADLKFVSKVVRGHFSLCKSKK